MKRSKTSARLLSRRTAWDNSRVATEKFTGLLKDRPGFKRPGSNKKPFPAGRGRRHTA